MSSKSPTRQFTISTRSALRVIFTVFCPSEVTLQICIACVCVRITSVGLSRRRQRAGKPAQCGYAYVESDTQRLNRGEADALEEGPSLSHTHSFHQSVWQWRELVSEQTYTSYIKKNGRREHHTLSLITDQKIKKKDPLHSFQKRFQQVTICCPRKAFGEAFGEQGAIGQ